MDLHGKYEGVPLASADGQKESSVDELDQRSRRQHPGGQALPKTSPTGDRLHDRPDPRGMKKSRSKSKKTPPTPPPTLLSLTTGVTPTGSNLYPNMDGAGRTEDERFLMLETPSPVKKIDIDKTSSTDLPSVSSTLPNGGRSNSGFEGDHHYPESSVDERPTASLLSNEDKPLYGSFKDSEPEKHVSVVQIKPRPPSSPPADEATPQSVNVSIPDERRRRTHVVPDTDDNKDNIELLRSEDMKKKDDESFDAGLFFEDGKRKVDYVLVFTEDDDADEERKKQMAREQFQKNLVKEGLEMEISERQAARSPQPGSTLTTSVEAGECTYEKDEKTFYIKLHAPWEVLTRYAEIMNMKMPLAENDMELPPDLSERFMKPFHYDESALPEIKDYFTAAYTRVRANQFIVEDQDTFFSNAQRGLIVHQILSRAVYEDVGDKTKNKFGIKKMLSHGSYVAAYPLHEGDHTAEGSAPGSESFRHCLYKTWASPRVWYKFQPLEHVRLYFGEKIGIYFTWLGYYTGLLIPAGIVGLIIFLYGCLSLGTNEISEEICDTDGVDATGNIIMCPLCDARCTYWRLSQSCTNAKVTYLFDNSATVFFAAFMALWATFFHEMWKRKESEIQYDWDVADFEEEETLRPEFEATVRQRRVNPINKSEEPYLEFSSRILRSCSSVWVVVFMLLIVLAAVFGVIVYRMTVSAALYSVSDKTVKMRATTITSITAACLNLIAIIILGKVYQIIAKFLTDFETHRTLTEWEDSFTLKMFLFQFVNHNASLFYIALVKGKGVGRPGDYNRDIGGARQEECDPAGCLIELCIQLAIIMVGKQAFNNFKELIMPKVMNWFKRRHMKEQEGKNSEKVTRWEKDYTMESLPELGLFDEYLEMVIQYGFVTIFVAAFPLAPLFALINNVIEVRLDAWKFVTQLRRPLAMRAQDIGIWFGILQGISQMAVISNAFIIAFTSEFIPKLVYDNAYEDDKKWSSYVDFALAPFDTADFEKKSIPDEVPPEFGNVTVCRFRGFRNPPGSAEEYDYSIVYWHVLAARLAFIIAFIFSVQALSWLVAYLVPDIPRNVKLQMLREKYLAKEAVMASEHLKREEDKKDD